MRYIFLLYTLLAFSCANVNENWEADTASPESTHQSVKQLTDVIIHDIFSPPQASRIYAYACLAAYEVMSTQNETYISLQGQLNGLDQLPGPPDTKICTALASNIALCTVGKALIFSEDKMEAHIQQLKTDYLAIRMPGDVYERSIAFGEMMAKAILDYANTDNYNETRSFPKFSVTDEPNRWKPTPPGYMEGIEPSWNKIRPFTLDSAQQFQPPFPTDFSTDENSTFYKETMEVYDAVVNASKEHKEIASFWDCNPYVLNVTGHVMHASKKITPGGHWMGIVNIACRQSNADLGKSLYAYTATSIALADAFISCWDEKYRSNLIRPETVINEHIDPNWVPLLQTPPFPEYTSGHSVISSAAAITLTDIFGDNFAFKDDTEVEFGLPVREFSSFLDASSEAAISRLYGGIHYRPAIDNGVEQGQRLGRFLVKKLKFTT